MDNDRLKHSISVARKMVEIGKTYNLNDIEFISVDTCIWCSHSRQGCFEGFSKKVIANHYFYWCHLILFETFPNLEFYEDFMENIEKFICVSEIVKKDIISKYPELEEKCEVIENYLDVQEIFKSSNKSVDFDVNGERLNIISV